MRSQATVRAGAAAVLALLLGAGACSASPSERGTVESVPPPLALTPGVRHPAALLPGDWPTYHHDAARSGFVPGVPPVRAQGQGQGLTRAWTAQLDGAVYGQPLVVRGTVVAATENDSLYGLDPGDGRVLWHRQLGAPMRLSALPCGNIDPLGVTGTPVFEPQTGLVFAVAELAGGRHLLVGVDPSSGEVLVRREVEPPRGDALVHQQRGALAVADGRVLIAYGGLYGDCGNYVGSVLSVPATGAGPVLSYAVPTSREGGLWATGGPVVDGSRILVSVGNGASTGGAGRSDGGYDGSDSVLALSLGLLRTDYFAPAGWAQDNAADLDLGSMTPALLGRFVLIVGKRGTGYVLDGSRLGGIGGQLSQARVCEAYGTAAVSGAAAYVPCADALARVDVDPGGGLHPGWQVRLGASGSPVVGGGAVWVVDYGAGELLALDPASGRVLQRAATGPVPHFASPVLTGDRVLLGTSSGVTAFTGA